MSFAYFCHLFLCFMPAYTLEVDMENYKGPKALLSLYETMTSIRARRRCNDPNGANDHYAADFYP